MPVLVCLTFGDKLYAEHISEKGVHLPREAMTAVVKDQLAVRRSSMLLEKLARLVCYHNNYISYSIRF